MYLQVNIKEIFLEKGRKCGVLLIRQTKANNTATLLLTITLNCRVTTLIGSQASLIHLQPVQNLTKIILTLQTQINLEMGQIWQGRFTAFIQRTIEVEITHHPIKREIPATHILETTIKVSTSCTTLTILEAILHSDLADNLHLKQKASLLRIGESKPIKRESDLADNLPLKDKVSLLRIGENKPTKRHLEDNLPLKHQDSLQKTGESKPTKRAQQ